MGVFGIDSPDELMFELNYQAVLKKLGHVPRIGARIYTPHKRENWEVLQVATEAFKLWGTTRLQVMCKRFQESLTTQEGSVTQPQPDFKINSIKPKINLGGGQPQL
jgi:hypothetical protein